MPLPSKTNPHRIFFFFFFSTRLPIKDGYSCTHQNEPGKRCKVGSRAYYHKTVSWLVSDRSLKELLFTAFYFPLPSGKTEKGHFHFWLVNHISSHFLSSYLYLTILTTKLKYLHTKALFIISQIQSM